MNPTTMRPRHGLLKNLVCITVTTISLFGCITPADHASRLQSSRDREFTLGVVQAEIRRGMSQSDVAQVLGSPNIVTKDRNGGDTWIYDKIASEASYSQDSGGVSGLGGAGGTSGSTLILGGLLGNYSRNSGAASTTQRTLTVLIKFDDDNKVKDFSYHSSKF